MPQPRKYKTNAERQAAYRARKAHRDAVKAAGTRAAEIVARVMSAEARDQ